MFGWDLGFVDWVFEFGQRRFAVVRYEGLATFFSSGLRPDTSLRDRGRHFGGRSQSELGHGYFNSTTPRRTGPLQSGGRPVLSGSKWHLELTLAPRRFPADEQPETGTTRLRFDRFLPTGLLTSLS
jgi:hypothetical protein